MIRVVDRWRGPVAVHSVTLVVLSVERKIVLGLELCSLITWNQELYDVSSATSFKGDSVYLMIPQWLQALSNSPLRMQIASHKIDEKGQHYSTDDCPLDYLGVLFTD